MENVSRSSIMSLIDMYNNGDEYDKQRAKEIVTIENERLVCKLIQKHASTYIGSHFEDLKQEGLMAICEHFTEYDPSKGKFSTFIAFYILHAITEYVATFVHGRTIHYHSYLKKLMAVQSRFAAEGRETYSVVDVAKALGVGIEAARKLLEMQLNTNAISIDGDGVMANVVSSKQLSPYETVEKREISNALESALQTLTPEQRKIIEMKYFGKKEAPTTGRVPKKNGKTEVKLMDYSFADIANALNTDVSTVRRSLNLALKKLKENANLASLVTDEHRDIPAYISKEDIKACVSLPAKAIQNDMDMAMEIDLFGDNDVADTLSA